MPRFVSAMMSARGVSPGSRLMFVMRMIGMRAAFSARTVPFDLRPRDGAVSRPVR
jgi:hypothetical protein